MKSMASFAVVGVIINTVEDFAGLQNEVIKMLSVLLSRNLDAQERMNILEKSFHIEMRQEVQQEVEHMCNLSQGVREDGRKEERNRIILNMLNMKKVLSDILEVTEASENDVLTLARENGLEVVR